MYVSAYGINRYISCDWPIKHGRPYWLPAYINIPAKAKVLPCERALALLLGT